MCSMGNMLGGRDLELFEELKRRKVLRHVDAVAFEQKQGVLGFVCGDDRRSRLQDLCAFHEVLQKNHRDEPKSFFFGWPGGVLSLVRNSPLIGKLITPKFADCAFYTVEHMLEAAAFNSFALHGHYPCLAAEYTMGEGCLYQVVKLSLAGKRRAKERLQGVPITSLCQFDLGSDGMKSYYFHRESWEVCKDELKRHFN